MSRNKSREGAAYLFLALAKAPALKIHEVALKNISVRTDEEFLLAHLLGHSHAMFSDMLAGNLESWTHVVDNGLTLTSQHTPAQEEHSILAFWNNALSSSPS